MADKISTGLPELDKVLSGEGTLRRGELSIFVGGSSSTIKTDLWRLHLERALKEGRTLLLPTLEMTPKFSLSDMGTKPPDKPIMPEPGS